MNQMILESSLSAPDFLSVQDLEAPPHQDFELNFNNRIDSK